MKEYFAVFVLCVINGRVPATTRDPKNNELVNVGLPGGKVDPGESPVEAAHRESWEEGWEFAKIDREPFYIQEIDGKPVAWFVGYNPKKLKNYKEDHRIQNIWSTLDDIKSSGYGNDRAVFSYLSLKEVHELKYFILENHKIH
jgi:hypothetical protein